MHARPRLGRSEVNRVRETAQLRRMIALLGRHDSAGQTAAWFAFGVRPTQYLTGYTDRKVLLSAAKKTEDYLAAPLVESSRSQDE